MSEAAVRIDIREGLTTALVDRVQKESQAMLAIACEQPELVHAACLVLEELCTNIVEHGHADWIELALTEIEGELNLFISDNGPAFDPTPAIKAKGIEEKLEQFDKRGLGLFMIRRLTDSFRYARVDGTNLVRLEMSVGGGQSSAP